MSTASSLRIKLLSGPPDPALVKPITAALGMFSSASSMDVASLLPAPKL